ncbi:hypothetical protein TKK_0011686 [Trichogramma kaykai]
MLKQEKDSKFHAYTSNSFKYPKLISIVLFLHAFSGCDTTSALFNKGKLNLIKVFTNKEYLLVDAEKFSDPSARAEEIAQAGIKIIRHLYGDKSEKGKLNKLRFNRFAKLSKKGPVKLESLPPTEGSAVQHAYRVYLQVQQWLGNKKKATDWGWVMKDSTLVPLYTANPLYPDKLLHQISCSCKKGCKVKSCTCKKHGLFCSILCVSCNAETCSNIADQNVEVPENGILDIEDNCNIMENMIEETFKEHTQTVLDLLDESEEETDIDSSSDETNIEHVAKKSKLK